MHVYRDKRKVGRGGRCSPRLRYEGGSGKRAITLFTCQMKGILAMTDIPAARFIADAMLGKLVKWLRVMGIDVTYDAVAADDQLLRSTKEEARILLTRDRRLTWRQTSTASAGCLFIESDYYHEQVRQVVQRYALQQAIQVFSRCLRCNTLLQTVTREMVTGRVPPYIAATQTTFKHCATCDRLYWAGTHRDHMLRQLQAMLGDIFSPAVYDLL